MDDWTEAQFERRATAAGNAFDSLRQNLQVAEGNQALPSAGDVIGRYEVVRELGQGGFGSVFEVRHDLLGHRFAMKVLNPLIAADPDWVKRFREEARITSLIGHENIVYVTDFGEDPAWGCYFVMELLQGQPLDVVIAVEGAQPAERVVQFAHAAASAFSAVHEVGIVHCDLKPSNVFVVPRRGPELWKFLDLGTSTVVMAAVQTQAMYGTPVYMAPEQSVGGDVTPLADQFALACVMYEMLTGEPPWRVDNWLQATAGVRATRMPKPPSELSSTCPPAWDDVIMRGFALDPAERWPSLEALARALEDRLKLDWKPAGDPLDFVPDAPGALASAPSVVITDGPSLVVDVDSGESSDARPRVVVEFRSRDRFNREVHRNLSVGGVFVPCDELPPLGTDIALHLRFAPTDATGVFSAFVVGHEVRVDAGRGFGVAVHAGERGPLSEFVRRVRGEGIDPQALIFRTAHALPESLTPGEWFVISRVAHGTPLKELRSMCAGLPVNVTDVVTDLVVRGLLTVGAPVVNEPEPVESSNVTHLGFGGSDVSAILARLEFYRQQANYLGAADLLKRAIQMSPSIGVFHYRLALLRMEFEGDATGALPSARRAVELDPHDELFRQFLDSLTR